MSIILKDSTGFSIRYLGSNLETGPLPAFFYFALSSEESLELHPYNQPAILAATSPSLRVFSFTIPGHGENLNKFHAMKYWAEHMAQGAYILEDFFEAVTRSVRELIDQGLVMQEKIALGGLSRGGFIATHLAARIPQVHTLLSFAPLTELMELKEFAEMPSLRRRASELDLVHLTDNLTHVRNIRFYIGNLDMRVNTDSCYHFIRRLADKGHEKHARHQKIELMIRQSVGHKGHGTDPHIFEEGTSWLKRQLLGEV
jgi:pimeloyl-ACP methyl ester carboxylesterase